jgi:hypothetical protein
LAFFAGLDFGAQALALLPLAFLWPLCATFLWLAPFFEAAFSGVTGAPCPARVAFLVLSAAFVMWLVSFLE